MNITYFVHSITYDNLNNKATGWLQGELAPIGIEKIKELPALISDDSFEAVFPSDLKRAVDSAELAFGKTHKIIPDRRLREANYGRLDGSDKAFKKRIKEYITRAYPDGESYQDCEARMREFLHEKKTEGYHHIAIVGHEATQLALEVICNGKTWEEAIDQDWRRAQAWQPGWSYEF